MAGHSTRGMKIYHGRDDVRAGMGGTARSGHQHWDMSGLAGRAGWLCGGPSDVDLASPATPCRTVDPFSFLHRHPPSVVRAWRTHVI